MWVLAGVSHKPSSIDRVSSRFRLLQPGKLALTLPPITCMCLFWAFSGFLESTTGDFLIPSEVLICWISTVLSMVVRGVLRVSYMTIFCLPPLLELASFASKSAQAFCSRGTCTNSNTTKVSFRIWTYYRYASIWGPWLGILL